MKTVFKKLISGSSEFHVIKKKTGHSTETEIRGTTLWSAKASLRSSFCAET